MPTETIVESATPEASVARLPFPIGIELEMTGVRGCPGDAIERFRQILEPHVPVRSGPRHGHQPNHWVVKYDGSCGYEISSPPLATENGLDEAAKVCRALTEAGATVSAKCGLHVHVGINHVLRRGNEDSAIRLLQFFNRYQEAFFLLAGPTRQNNQYCRRFPDNLERGLRDGIVAAYSGHGRYWWLNGTSFNTHGTLEFRLMPGTLDAAFVTGWTSLLLTAFDYVVNAGKKVQWGKAKAKDNRMLLYTMLQQAGCYGKAIRNRKLATAAREWAGDRFKQLNTFTATP